MVGGWEETQVRFDQIDGGEIMSRWLRIMASQGGEEEQLHWV